MDRRNDARSRVVSQMRRSLPRGPRSRRQQLFRPSIVRILRKSANFVARKNWQQGGGCNTTAGFAVQSPLHEFHEIVHSTSSFRSAINARYSACARPLSKATAWRSLARRFYCSKSPTALEHPFLKVISFVAVEYLSSCAVYEPLTRLLR